MLSRLGDDVLNVGWRLSQATAEAPHQVAVVEALPGRPGEYRQVTFQTLDQDSDRIAAGLRAAGVAAGMRLVLLVPPGIDFIALFFALLKSGAVTVLIDPGMGRKHLLRCLEEAEPQGFVAVPRAQAARRWYRRRFPSARFNVTVGRRWCWGGMTLQQLRRQNAAAISPETQRGDPAAIIFTSGSTGAPKGVLYTHGNFDRQIDEIRDQYGIQPGGVDLSGFPLFALFNAAMGVTTVVPEMDFTRPAQADPQKIIRAIQDWKATQAFGSPALWNTVGRYCETHQIRLPTLHRVFSAGAPVPVHVLKRLRQTIADEGEIHTPYGATEALPVASISASEVLAETARASEDGAGTCVGRRFPGIEWKVIEISDEPLGTLRACRELPRGQVGELMVRGPVVTRQYVTGTQANAYHKVADGNSFWHRMGDVGYLDDQDRFWYCGRKSQRVPLPRMTLFTDPCEAIVNRHERVYRSALVGAPVAGHVRPVFVVELWPDRRPSSPADERQLLAELWDIVKSHPLTREVQEILLHPALPVDVRHNSKIFREELARWAAQRLA